MAEDRELVPLDSPRRQQVSAFTAHELHLIGLRECVVPRPSIREEVRRLLDSGEPELGPRLGDRNRRTPTVVGYNSIGDVPPGARLEVVHMARPASPSDVENAVRDYIAGESCQVVAARYGVGDKRLRSLLIERGLWRTRAEQQAIRAANVSAAQIAKSTLPSEEIVTRYLAGEPRQVLADAYGVSRTAIDVRLKAAGVPLRSLAETNRALAAARSPEENREIIRAAQAATRGRKHTPEHRNRIAKTREERQHGISEDERFMATLLKERGLEPIPQKAIGPYNVDLAAGPIAVEVFGGGWHAYGRHRRRTPERFRYILDQGWGLVVIWNLRHRWPMNAAAADYVVAFAEQVRRDPSAAGQYRVIWSDGQVVPSGDFDVDDLTLKPSRRGSQRARAGDDSAGQ